MNFIICFFFLLFCSIPFCLAAASADFTNIYATDSYADVVEIDKHAAFAVPSEALDENTLVKSVRNNLKRQAIVLMLTERFFNDNTYSIRYKVNILNNHFVDTTGMPLEYVMTAVRNRADCEEYARAFRMLDIAFINSYTNINSHRDFPARLTGVNLIQFDALKTSARKDLKKLIKKEAMSMKKYVREHFILLFEAAPSAAVTVRSYSSSATATAFAFPNSRYSMFPSSSRAVSEPAPQHEIVTEARPTGAFTFIFKGIENFELAKVFGLALDSAFMINEEDMATHTEIIQKAFLENVKLIWEVDAELLRSRSAEADIRSRLANHLLRIYGLPRFEFVIVPGALGSAFSTALNQNRLKEIRVTSQFDPENAREAQFRNFVVVDLTVGSAANTLKVLGTRLVESDLDPFNFDTCANILTPADTLATLTENAKINNFREGFNQRAYAALYINVHRGNVFPDSFHQFITIPDFTLRDGSFAVTFHGENGIDGGGLTRDWFSLLAKQMFNPNYALFLSSETDQNVFIPNKSSHVNAEHLDYFRFVGRFIAKGIIENIQLDCHFSRSVYKLMLSRTPSLLDLAEVDGDLYRSLSWILENDVTDALADTTFSVDIDEFGQHRTVDLRPNGSNEPLTEANKFEYVRLMIKYALETSIGPQVTAFLDGFRRLIPRNSVLQFRIREFAKLISGSPTIDVEDWKANTILSGYTAQSPQIIWFWQAIETFSQAERRILLKYATGSTSVPPEGFSNLRNRGQISLFKINRDVRAVNLLPESHTCFNRLDLPIYPSYRVLLDKLRVVLRNAEEGFSIS